MRGCHLPLLYIGLEYGLTNNVKLADKFLEEARQLAPNDPYVWHEMGILAFQMELCEPARNRFLKALELSATDEMPASGEL